ncbi:tetratricopeptide repeat protein [Vibrio pelagius]|uniref:Tetratricopeptide repeat protein n=1 Tax=Vibrio pelagius TaxID=28169 RepID=A0ABY5G218_VIBPE|nr:tetratricopeptide repeat protein [Vibrio pelagius]UTT84046.1 tetratricopeptide repeat protein [Vibrio pelagius]
MRTINRVILFMLPLFLIGCVSSDETGNDFNSELYAGKPIDTLSNDAPPLNEKEAIVRGDKALRDNNVDLALYEYIRSLSYPEKEFHDRTLFTIGRIHQSRENYPLAEKSYLAVLNVDPAHTGALEQLGSLYTKQNRLEEGLSYFYKAINSDQLRMSSGQSISNNHSLTKSQAQAFKVDDQSPLLAYMGVGVLRDVAGDHDVAQILFGKVLTISPRSVKGLMNMGYSHYMDGDYDEAMRFTTKALNLEPNNEKAQNNLALIYLAKGEVQKSVNTFMRHMDAPEALNNVGYFLILQGKPEEAIPYLQQAIDKKASYYELANKNLETAISQVREMN